MEFFQIHVPIWQFALSQVFGAVYIAVGFFALQIKDKSKTLKWYAVGNILSIISNALLLNFILVGTKSVSFFKNISFSHLQSNREKIGKIFAVMILLFFIVLAFAVSIFTWNGIWFNWVLVSMLAFSYFGEWHRNVHILRLGSFLYMVTVFVNALMFANVADMVKCVITTIAIITFYVRFFKNRERFCVGTEDDYDNYLEIMIDKARFFEENNIVQWNVESIKEQRSKDKAMPIINDGRFYVIKHNGKVVAGCIVSHSNEEVWGKTQDSIFLKQITSSKKGAGKRLIYELAKLYKTKGTKHIKIDCQNHIEGLKQYYKNIGFDEVRVQPHRSKRIPGRMSCLMNLDL